jgi:hypothetical protein
VVEIIETRLKVVSKKWVMMHSLQEKQVVVQWTRKDGFCSK